MNKHLFLKIINASLFFFAPFIARAAGTLERVCNPGELCNPLRGIGNLDELIIAVLGIVVKIGAYVAVFFIIWSGFLFVKAQGNSTELQKAKDTFLWTIVGIAILLGAQALALALGSTINTIVK